MGWNKRWNAGLKRFMAVAVLFVIGVTAGCGKKAEQTGSKGGGFCSDISVFDCLLGQSFCDKGMVRIEEGLMMFYEYETGRSYPLCSDAYCEHVPYDEKKNPDPVCEATMKDLKTACVHGDYVYTIQQTGIQELTVQARNLKESGYRVVAKLPYCQTFSTSGYNEIIGDKAYLLLGEIDKVFGDELISSYTSNDLYTFLVELDLRTGEYKTLFHIEGEEKYQILQTVYDKEGIYCRCYYGDVDFDEETMKLTVNEYREAFYYVPYDGTGVKELCKELVDDVSYKNGEMPVVTVSGISEYGAYFVNEEMTKVECYCYDGKKETVFELPEGYTRLHIDGVSGNKMIMTLTDSKMNDKIAGLDLTTGELIIRDKLENISYVAVCDEGFWRYIDGEQGTYRELCTYRDIFYGEGTTLISIEG